MPTLLAKLGPDPSLRLPLLGVLARRPLPNISCASASFFLRKRSVVLSHLYHLGSCLAMLTGLYDVVERNGLSICRHDYINSFIKVDWVLEYMLKEYQLKLREFMYLLHGIEYHTRVP